MFCNVMFSALGRLLGNISNLLLKQTVTLNTYDLKQKGLLIIFDREDEWDGVTGVGVCPLALSWKK